MKSTNPTTILDFQQRFDSEEAREAVLFRWRWPDGFRCPRCGGEEATRLATRRQDQCEACRHQVSITAGTAMHKTKLPLMVWSWAIFLVARHEKSISALQLKADLGLVEVDEAYVGGTEKGTRPGRSASKKGIVVTALEVRPNGRLGSARMKVIPDVKTESLVPFVQESVAVDRLAAELPGGDGLPKVAQWWPR